MNEATKQKDLDDINLKLQTEMDILAGELSRNDYKVEIKVMGEFIHITSEIQDGIDGIDPTDSDANQRLFNNWREHIIKHIIKTFSELNPIETKRGVCLPSKNIMLCIGHNNVHNIDYLIEYNSYPLSLLVVETEEENKGSNPYTLSRLEYLEMRLNTYLANLTRGNAVIGIYYANPKTDTITLEIRYQSNVDRVIVDELFQEMVRLLLKQLMYHGWQEWVKIKVVEKVVEKPVEQN